MNIQKHTYFLITPNSPPICISGTDIKTSKIMKHLLNTYMKSISLISHTSFYQSNKLLALSNFLTLSINIKNSLIFLKHTNFKKL